MTLLRPLIAGALLMAAAPPALAAGPAEPVAEPPVAAAPAPPLRWQFTVRPYIWASGTVGTLRPFTGAPTLEIDRSFSELLEDIDGAVFVSAAAQRGRFIVLADFQRIVSSREGTVSGVPASGSLDQTTFTLAAGYKAFVGQRSSVDVFAGFRAFRFQVDVEAAGGAVSASPTRSFVDPIIGVQASALFAPRWSGTLYADIGGFGVGNELAVVVTGLINYHVSPSVIISGGYRQMWVDYDDGSTVADLSVGGPMFGIAWRF
jgi:hypothetical protein